MNSPEQFHANISRDSLSPRVRSYDDNLDTQVRDLFDKYHLPHYDQEVLAKAIEDRTVTLADAHHLRDLLAQRDHIRRTGELPPEVARNLEFQLKEAREILGKDFLGPEEVKEVFGVGLALAELPPIAYSREDLELAKERGEMLVLRISHDALGNPLTMERVNALLAPRFKLQGKGNVFFRIKNSDIGWFTDELFYTAETPRFEWKIISKEILPESFNEDCFDQIRILRDSLSGFFTPEERAECTDEKLAELKSKSIFYNDDNELDEVERQMVELLKDHRRTAVESLYDVILYFGVRNEYLLPTMYEWTRSRSKDGFLVEFGIFSPAGAGIFRRTLTDRHEKAGICSVR